jgi:hypothetical protein
MPASRTLLCLATLTLSNLAFAQTPPTAYTVIEAAPFYTHPTSMTIFRSGDKALMDVKPSPSSDDPAPHRTFTLYDLKAGISHSWQPAAGGAQPTCSVGRFSGNWGDPFVTDSELSDLIAKGTLKPSGTESIGGIAATDYAGDTPQGKIKIWLDTKDNLVMRAQVSQPGSTDVQTLIDIKAVSFATPSPSLFVLPASCAALKPDPTPAELIGDETGDDASNYVGAIQGPGSKDSCSVVLRVVQAKTMTPVTAGFQVAIDTTWDVDHPTAYTFGVGEDGSSTYSGGGLHEITNQIRNGIVRIDNPPPYFNLSVNVKLPHHGAGTALIYRQCFAPQTVLLYVVKDLGRPTQSADYLWVKAGKFATVPAAH